MAIGERLSLIHISQYLDLPRSHTPFFCGFLNRYISIHLRHLIITMDAYAKPYILYSFKRNNASPGFQFAEEKLKKRP